jgi:beta-carotene hydroxylase
MHHFEQRRSSRQAVLPPLRELGLDLTHVTARQRWSALALPLGCVAAAFVFASFGWWFPAMLAVAAYTFSSYGSTSHDLVHGTLGLPRHVDRVLLSIIELLGLRSGHAYLAAHLHHHRQFPQRDDVEAAAAHGSAVQALLAGPLHQFRIWKWALANAPRFRHWILLEGIACVALGVTAVMLMPMTCIPMVYVSLVVMGSWSFPLLTAYLPHDPAGADELRQTRRFRGRVASVVFAEHLYHLEHHLYPKVPHQNWSRLAARLDPYLDRAGVQAITFGVGPSWRAPRAS